MKTRDYLTPWQKKQASLLYYFASMDYLKGLQDRLHSVCTFGELTLDKSRAEGRDKFLRNTQWGERNTTENWANNAWCFLTDFQRSIARDIADRASQTYHVTGAYQCGRGMDEFSMMWTTPTEQDRFEAMFEELSRYARNIDKTMDKTGESSRWDDFGLTAQWQKQANHFPMLPKFQVKTDVTAESGQLPPRTGVYVSIDDPCAALQFAWTGGGRGRLLDSATFNDLGKAALAATGRSKLWVDGKAMLSFVLANLDSPDLRDDSFFQDSQNEELAPTLVARNAFTYRPSRWCYVELLSDEFEPIETEAEAEQDRPDYARYESGTICQQRGIYFSPARQDSRRTFEIGDVFPHIDSNYGKTIWQLAVQ